MNIHFHVSLNVRDLERSIQFYTAVFDLPPDKVAPRYARFTLEDPPLVLGLSKSNRVKDGNRVEHLGFRMESAKALEVLRARWSALGLVRREQHRTTCCHAVQDKVWLRDPDGNDWEFYELIEDLRPPVGEEAEYFKATASCCD